MMWRRGTLPLAARVRETLTANRSTLNELAQLLLTHETVERQALTRILRDLPEALA